MFSKNNKKMIAERSAERTLKYGLVKLNVGLASVLLATGLTFAGSQTASADTVTTSTEAQTTEVAPGQNDAATQTENQGLTKESATNTQTESSSATQEQVDEAQKNVNDTQTQINQNQNQQDNVKQQISNADSQISNIQSDYNAKNNQINNDEEKIVDNYQSQINNIQNNQVNDEKQDLNNQISDLNGQVETLQDQQNSSSQADDNSKYANVAGETVTPLEGTQKVLDKIDTNADYMSNLYRNDLIGDTTGNSSARTNGGHIISDTYGVDADADSGDNYSLKAGGDDSLTLNKTFDDMYQNGVINNKLSDVDPIKNGQLTTDQERELAIIVADKLNNTREKLGLSRWVMTEKDFELAQQRASQQSAINLQHNVDDINSVFGGVYGENLALAFLHKGDNFNDVMGYIDASVSQLIDSDKGSDYGHRDNILSQDGHIALGIKQVSEDTIVISMDWANTDVDDLDSHDLLALPAQLKAQGPTKKATTVVDNSAKIAQLKNQITNLETKLANVQFDYNKLSSSDKKNYDSLKNEIEVTHTKANNARNALKQNSQASIDQIAQTKTNLYNTLYDLQDQMKTLQDKLVLQKTKLVQLQEELNNSKKSDDKDNVTQPDDSKSDDNKTDGNKTDDNKSDGNKSDDSKSNDSKTDNNKSEGNKSDDNKTNDNKSDNQDNVAPVKPSDNKTDDKDNVAPVKPSDSKNNNGSVVDIDQGQDGSQTVYDANKDNEEPAKTIDEDKVVVNDVKKVATTSEKKVEVKVIAKKAEAPKADTKAATLPQMGEKDNNEAAVVGLGLAGVAGALGLGVLNKKRS
ncbi:SEC10/PgrA surface exclusion domain-containing protein [Ligilactobacillus salivarius]|uniref:SEC10/PgrA surface exclusion domain-containing protein n=1 Tax=Ligilactobacillus salivarius TaxID=1624 RepID=UPI00263B14AA|nr:SEC10/PgrA surface exclusion domain-containing protein [Ligilactobacillus salivarius]MDN4848657.1 SEC10/PgrA surface exclusion domain-containing protein [Ligilactobacillus salivarius]MDW3023601.1 SEC10/PgrA surface exclusion domain-containing protein [Ligilactobacillus salivarius]